MKFKESLAVFLIFFLGISLCLYAEEGMFQKKKPEEKETKSLIRKELLLKERKKLEPPRRNIFSPRSSRFPGSQVDAFRTEQNSPPESSPEAPEDPEAPATLSENRPRVPSNIRYIGYIHSEDRIVGVIIFEGNALAVEVGEMISAGVKIEKITLEEIEIIGPDSEIRKYTLEGERE